MLLFEYGQGFLCARVCVCVDVLWCECGDVKFVVCVSVFVCVSVRVGECVLCCVCMFVPMHIHYR